MDLGQLELEVTEQIFMAQGMGDSVATPGRLSSLAACRTSLDLGRRRSCRQASWIGPRRTRHAYPRGLMRSQPRMGAAAGAADGGRYTAASANIRFMFHAMVTRLHSPRALSSPRSRNWRKPITDLMIPNTGSGVCLRRA